MKKVYYVYEKDYDGGIPLFVSESSDTACAVVQWLCAKHGRDYDYDEIVLDSTDNRGISHLFEDEESEEPVSLDTILRWCSGY